MQRYGWGLRGDGGGIQTVDGGRTETLRSTGRTGNRSRHRVLPVVSHADRARGRQACDCARTMVRLGVWRFRRTDAGIQEATKETETMNRFTVLLFARLKELAGASAVDV